MGAFDATDLKLLRALQAEPGLSVARLGERIGLSHTPCWRRLKRLEAEGVVRRRELVLDAEALGLHVTAFCFIRLRRHDKAAMESFEAAARAHPNVLQCHTTSGEQDYVLRVVAESITAYERLVKDELLALPSVALMQSSFALREIKDSRTLPI